MYKKFYNLKENPFSVTADPDFFYSSPRHDEAISHLSYGIQERKGILVITGEIGTGKTTLCRTLLTRLDKQIKTALILNPNFSEIQLLQIILKDFGLQSASKDKYILINTLNEFLIDESNQGNNVCLIVDESQNLGVRQLEQIRLLSNLETTKDKLLQIILVGQPELCDKLKLTSLRQLNQRIAVRFHLTPLNKNEIHNYVLHRLRIASHDQKIIANFTDEAIRLIYEISAGTPRLINILCDRALLAGFSTNNKTIDEKIITNSSREVIHQ